MVIARSPALVSPDRRTLRRGDNNWQWRCLRDSLSNCRLSLLTRMLSLALSYAVEHKSGQA